MQGSLFEMRALLIVCKEDEGKLYFVVCFWSSFFIFLSFFRTKDLRFFSLLKMKTLRIAA